MIWLFRRIVDRLLAQLMMLLSAKMGLASASELAESEADLLRQANDLEKEDVPGLKELAGRLRMRAEKLAQEDKVPSCDQQAVVIRLAEEDWRNPDAITMDSKKDKSSPLNGGGLISASPAKRRGRPRKGAES